MLVCFSLATFSCLCVDKEWEESRVNQMLRLYHANMIKKKRERYILESDDNNHS